MYVFSILRLWGRSMSYHTKPMWLKLCVLHTTPMKVRYVRQKNVIPQRQWCSCSRRPSYSGTALLPRLGRRTRRSAPRRTRTGARGTSFPGRAGAAWSLGTRPSASTQSPPAASCRGTGWEPCPRYDEFWGMKNKLKNLETRYRSLGC